MAQTTLLPKRATFNQSIKKSQKTLLNTQTSLTNLSKLLKERTEDREKISSQILTERKKREYATIRQEQEDELKAKQIASSPNIASKTSIVDGTGSFIDRIVNTLGYLAAGWIIRNLPTWEGMAKEFIARLQEAGRIIGSFVTGAIRVFQASYSLITGAIQNLKNFDLTDSSNNIRNSFDELVNSINDMGSELEAGVKLITTPLTQTTEDGRQVGSYSREEIPALGSTSTDMGAYYSKGTIPESVKSDTKFTEGVTSLAKKYNIPEDYLYAVMGFETGGTFNPSEKNKAGSGATGLIQFMPSTARGLGTSTDQLSKMSRAEQLKYVDKYFSGKGIEGGSLSDVYMAVLFPAAVGKPDNFVLFGKGAMSGYTGRAYTQNKGLDLNGDGSVTKAEAASKVQSYLPKGVSSTPQAKGTSTTNTAASSSALAQAAQAMKGMSSAAGPGGGNLACVWAVNQVFKKAGMTPPWGTSDYVPTAESSMIKAGYASIPVGQQKPGDLYIVHGQKHIGIVLPNGNIISNSSSGAKFSWEASLKSYQQAYGGAGKFYRMPGAAAQTSPQQANTTSSNLQSASVLVKKTAGTYETGAGYNPNNQFDKSNRPVVLSQSAAYAFSKMIADSAGKVKGSDVASSQRTKEKNASLKGSAPNSAHLYGEALDLSGTSAQWMKANGKKYGWIYGYDHGEGSSHFNYKGPGTPFNLPAPALQQAQISSQPQAQTPPPAQISQTPSQQSKQQLSQALTPERKAQDIVAIIPEQQGQSPPAQMSQPSIGRPSPSVSMATLLNNFMKQKLLLDLSYV